MKQTLILLTACLFTLTSFSQSEKYMKAMQDRLSSLDTMSSPTSLRDLSGGFERIADAEKTQWQPYYYAALSQLNSAYMLAMNANASNGPSVLDPLADKAEQLINKAEELSKDNSEIYLIRKMIASLRMMADPMNRYMKYGPEAQKALETARSLNPENPRIYLLEGQDKFFTPEQYGGSKTEAKKLFELALQKFDAFKPASAIDPTWGRKTAEYFLNQANQK